MKNCNQYLYADDVAIHGKNAKTIIKTLISALKICLNYCKKYKLKINENKSKAIFFTCFTRVYKIPNNLLQIENPDIP